MRSENHWAHVEQDHRPYPKCLQLKYKRRHDRWRQTDRGGEHNTTVGHCDRRNVQWSQGDSCLCLVGITAPVRFRESSEGGNAISAQPTETARWQKGTAPCRKTLFAFFALAGNGICRRLGKGGDLWRERRKGEAGIK